MKSICVFAGSNKGTSAGFEQAAVALGEELARRNMTLVYGAGNVGLMGIIASTVLANGGQVIGVIPEFLVEMEVAHLDLTALHVVASMHQRKLMMSDLSDGVIALPGGLGTLEELFEMLTWLQLGVHSKPVAVLNPNGFYDGLLGFLDQLVSDGFMNVDHRDMLIQGEDPALVLDTMASHRPPSVSKWLDKVKA